MSLCEKIAFKSLIEIQKAKAGIKKSHKTKMSHYLCQECGNYHLTTKNDGKKFIKAKPARMKDIEIGPLRLDRKHYENLPKPVKAVTNLGDLFNEVREKRDQE